MTTASTATETRYEVEVDTKIADLWSQYQKMAGRAEMEESYLHALAGDRKDHKSRNDPGTWRMTFAEVLATGPRQAYNQVNWDKYVASHAILQDEATKLHADAMAAEALYTGWSRFFLVINHGGHIHSTRNCSTCYARTIYGWLPQLSGLSEADAVESQGPRLCSVCFPSAPVEWTLGVPKTKGCDGTGRYVTTSRRYAACPACGKTVGLTTNGNIRKHTPA